jgi:hypothetical protein
MLLLKVVVKMAKIYRQRAVAVRNISRPHTTSVTLKSSTSVSAGCHSFSSYWVSVDTSILGSLNFRMVTEHESQCYNVTSDVINACTRLEVMFIIPSGKGITRLFYMISLT